MFTLLGVQWAFWISGFIGFDGFWKKIDHFFQYFFCIPLYVCGGGRGVSPIIHMLDHFILSCRSLICSFFQSFLLYFGYFLLLHPQIHWHFLLLCLVPPLISFIIFFILVAFFFILRNFIWIMFMSSISGLIMFTFSFTFLSIYSIFVIVVTVFLNANMHH